MSLKTKLYVVTAILGLSLLILTLRYSNTKSPILYAAAVTSGTTFYHFAMRLLAGGLIHAAFHNRMDYTKKWFQEKKIGNFQVCSLELSCVLAFYI